jgi:hypothetical protein
LAVKAGTGQQKFVLPALRTGCLSTMFVCQLAINALPGTTQTETVSLVTKVITYKMELVLFKIFHSLTLLIKVAMTGTGMPLFAYPAHKDGTSILLGYARLLVTSAKPTIPMEIASHAISVIIL